MTQDSINYSFFLDDPPNDPFLFSLRLLKNFRPSVGDSIADPVTLRNFRIMRDEFDFGGKIRITDDDRVRITDDGKIRVTGILSPSKDVTHNYFIQPANNPQRISTWTTQRFDDDQTLRQLFR